jgi:hypothetical protein
MIPPIFAIASSATTISGVMGMKIPIASPLPSPRERNAFAQRFTSL